MGGSYNLTTCGWTAGNLGQGFVCGYAYALAYKMPLNGVNAQFGSPYSTRPDAAFDQGATAGGPSGNWSCTPVEGIGCWHYDFGGDGNVDSGITFTQMNDNRDAYNTWIGLVSGIWQWNSDNGPDADFPDELGADLLKNDVDGDIDGDFTNSTIDLDDDYDSIFDWFDVDDDNDGIWDYFEIDSNFDLDDDTGQNTAISSKATTVTIMMTTVTMRTLTTMASIRPFGTKESCHKACEARVSMTLTTITTVFLTEKTKMTITMDDWMLTKKNSRVASGARNNPPGTMTTTVL